MVDLSHGITTVSRIHLLGTMNAYSKCHVNPSNSCLDTYFSAIAIPRAMPLAWLNTKKVNLIAALGENQGIAKVRRHRHAEHAA